MLKHAVQVVRAEQLFQPPSGGCVLKHKSPYALFLTTLPAAFGRLCVETNLPTCGKTYCMLPAAFGRLCVETFSLLFVIFHIGQPPSGGCVLKLKKGVKRKKVNDQPPSGGCVLKPLRNV